MRVMEVEEMVRLWGERVLGVEMGALTLKKGWVKAFSHEVTRWESWGWTIHLIKDSNSLSLLISFLK